MVLLLLQRSFIPSFGVHDQQFKQILHYRAGGTLCEGGCLYLTRCLGLDKSESLSMSILLSAFHVTVTTIDKIRLPDMYISRNMVPLSRDGPSRSRAGLSNTLLSIADKVPYLNTGILTGVGLCTHNHASFVKPTKRARSRSNHSPCHAIFAITSGPFFFCSLVRTHPLRIGAGFE